MSYLFVVEAREKKTRKAWRPIYHGTFDCRRKADSECKYHNNNYSFSEYRVSRYERTKP